MIGWVDTWWKAELLAGCRSALFLAYDEDFGYMTLEAPHSGKPIITEIVPWRCAESQSGATSLAATQPDLRLGLDGLTGSLKTAWFSLS